MKTFSSYASANLSASEKAMAEGIAQEGLTTQARFKPEPFFKNTGKGHYGNRTVEDLREARQGKDKSE